MSPLQQPQGRDNDGPPQETSQSSSSSSPQTLLGSSAPPPFQWPPHMRQQQELLLRQRQLQQLQKLEQQRQLEQQRLRQMQRQLAARDRLFAAPLALRHINIKGANRTQHDIIRSEIRECMADAMTYKDVLMGVAEGANKLDGLRIFDTVELTLMKAEGGSPTQTDVMVSVKEKDRFRLEFGINTDLQKGHGEDLDGESQGTWRNVTGRADMLTLGLEHALQANFTEGNSQQFLRYIRPRVNVLQSRLVFDAALRRDVADKRRYSSHMELSRGVQASLATLDARHKLSFESAWRDVMPIRHPVVPYAHDASVSIIAEARPSMKQSVTYTYTNDQRDDWLAPTYGGYCKASGECAFGSGVHFLKGTLGLQKHVPLFGIRFDDAVFPVSLSLGSSLGLLRPFFNEAGRSNIVDRFSMGGALGMRGFQYHGVGPRAPKYEGGRLEKGDALGGDISYVASLALTFPFLLTPWLAHSGIRMQAFVNAGNLTTWGTTLKDLIEQDRPRVSVGLGLFGNLMGVGRLELNCSTALNSRPQDITQRWQLGLGVSFT